MSDVAHMVSSADHNSLVLLDEVGSGTSLEEGGALAWAVMEALINARATTVLATHALFLTRLAALYPTVANYHLESEDAGEGRLRLTHVVRKGVTQATHYGLSLAAVTSIPPSVLRRAENLALTMTPPTQMGREDDSEGVRQRAVYHLAHRLLALAQAALPTTSTSSTSLPTPVITPPDPGDREKNMMETSSINEGSSTSLTSRGNRSASDEVAGGEAVAPDAAATAHDEELRDQLKTLLQEFMEQVVHPEAPVAQEDSNPPAQSNDE
ncbi:mutS protein homolog 4-like [Panulirus ornatus]|uniref:mutS protein homolog 4-like n=1 Tax=Panulirus ornatus TaxID=150431 RepID=UPI003A870F25